MSNPIAILDNMIGVVKNEANAIRKGNYIFPVCNGVSVCAMGAFLVAAGGVNLGMQTYFDKALHETLEANPAAQAALDALNAEASEADHEAEGSWSWPLEALFEETDLGREGLVEVIEAAKARVAA